MKFFFRNYWVQVIAVFAALFLSSRVVAGALSDVQGTGRLSTAGDASSGEAASGESGFTSDISENTASESSESSSENPLDELYESTDWSDGLDTSHAFSGTGSSSGSAFQSNTTTAPFGAAVFLARSPILPAGVVKSDAAAVE